MLKIHFRAIYLCLENQIIMTLNPKIVHCFLSCMRKFYWWFSILVFENGMLIHLYLPTPWRIIVVILLNYCNLILRSFPSVSGTKLVFRIKVVCHFLCNKLLHKMLQVCVIMYETLSILRLNKKFFRVTRFRVWNMRWHLYNCITVSSKKPRPLLKWDAFHNTQPAN